MKKRYFNSLWYLLLLVVFCLKLIFGTGTVNAELFCDVNRDGRIGLEEAIYALQVVAAGTVVCIDNLECSTPPPGKACIAGQLVDTENNQPIENDSTIQIVFYDGLAFAQNPTGTPPLPIDSITINSCGRFLAQGVTVPTLGLLAIATDDVSGGGDDYVTTAANFPVAPGYQINNINIFATRHSTDDQWTSTAGNPFSGSTFNEIGAFAPIFKYLDYPVAGVKILVSPGAVRPEDDYYFSDSSSSTRSTIDSNLDATGPNGMGIIVNTGLLDHSGQGSEPAGCYWPWDLAKSIPGVLMVQEIEAESTETGTSCP